MAQVIDYFFATISPWAHLGHDRFVAIAKKHGATVAVKPMNLGEVFPVSGGLPLSKRAPQRQAYRLVELQRWAQFLNRPMNVQPKYFPVNGDLAAHWILAANELGGTVGLDLAGAVGRAIWEQERNIADAATMEAVARECGLPVETLAARAQAADIAAKYSANTQEAIARGVFGAPTYAVGEELFWGQDRLDFLDRKMAK
ncbi:MAG TPA: 2-hydroxychromene-2-carboxylate isomerase [Casimicrobiaceae bacterium]|nr:2-hydroxychromene-2-carboxylate isomerase [Casimicrobiaceae bacterium]